MGIELRFLDWDAPVTTKVREFLFPQEICGPVELSRDLIVVPTRQAGRRLREALALHFASQKTALLSLRVVTPAFFLHPEDEADTVAMSLEVSAVWADVLMKADLSCYGGLFPARIPSQRFIWALQTGEMIEGLRGTLADGGYRISDVYREFGSLLEEKERWHDLADLETVYLERLDGLGLKDPCVEMIKRAESPEPPGGIERIVVAAVPDPTPLMVRKLERLSSKIPIAVLVHAPVTLADCFDGWGRPLTVKWKDRYIDVFDPDTNIILSGSPRLQSRRVLELMAQEAERFGPADVAIGVPDAEVVPFLEADLAGAGLVPFNPAGKSADQHPLNQLLQAFRGLCSEGDYPSVSAFVRNSDVLDCLQKKHRIRPSRLLEEMDNYQSRHLPQSLDDMVRVLARAGAAKREYRKFAKLAKAIDVVSKWKRMFEAGDVDSSLRSFLQAVYEFRTVDSRKPEDGDFVAVAEAVDAALRRISQGPLTALGMRREDTLELLLWYLGKQRYYPEPEDAVIDLEGWLELPWNDAPFMIVTGMNEGRVPDSRYADVFLPDTLRRQLNLRHDEDRLARDAYLMTTLIESRRGQGRVCFIVGKTGSTGDVLKPSRLLFHCSDAQLPRRAGQLFGTPSEEQAGCPSSISFLLEAVPPPDVPRDRLELKTISVTALKDYLQCPFRFYLKHVLEMEELDDQKMELDVLDFGSLVHDVLREMALNEEMRWCEDVDRLQDFLCARAEAWVTDRFCLSLPLRIQLESARQRLRQVARVQVGLVREGWEIVHCEMDIESELEGVLVRGKVDRVDRHRQSGKVRILDYKTSDRVEGPEAVHLGPLPGNSDEWPPYVKVEHAGRQKRWMDLQLPLYAVLLPACDRELQGPFELGYFNLPKSVDDTGVVLWEGPPATLMESAVTCARGIIRDIRSRRFWPPSRKTRYDDFERLFVADPAACINTETFLAFINEGKAG